MTEPHPELGYVRDEDTRAFPDFGEARELTGREVLQSVGNGLKRAYWHLRTVFVKAWRSGWRPAFCWGMVGVCIAGGIVAYAVMPVVFHDYPPEQHTAALNTTIGLVIGAIIVRGVEKHAERTAGVNGG